MVDTEDFTLENWNAVAQLVWIGWNRHDAMAEVRRLKDVKAEGGATQRPGAGSKDPGKGSSV